MTTAGPMLLARTAVHAHPAQVANRVRLRAQMVALRRWPRAGRRLMTGPDPGTAVGWPATFVPIDARTPQRWPTLAELATGRIRLLDLTRDLGDPPDWHQPNAPTLWRHHLHYWDWAYGLVSEPDMRAARAAFSRLWQSWQAAAVYGNGEAWLPYPTATRAWTWCSLYHSLVAGNAFDNDFRSELAAHTGFLRWHLETDIGGNHLLRELKALAGLAVFFSDGRLLNQTLARLTRQLTIQVLADGGHYERAPAYHCHVLADLLDLADLLRTTGRALVPALTAAITRMRRWLGAVVSPAGTVPPLNDGYPVHDALLRELRPEQSPITPLRMLPDSGLAIATTGGWHLLADIGQPGPEELPAHAHAGTLGCLVHVDRAPFLIDTGTSTYEPGRERDYERPTAAHNTVEVDGVSSTEVWGAFRAARRARVHSVTAHAGGGEIVVRAVHDGYRHLPGGPFLQRRW